MSNRNTRALTGLIGRLLSTGLGGRGIRRRRNGGKDDSGATKGAPLRFARPTLGPPRSGRGRKRRSGGKEDAKVVRAREEEDLAEVGEAREAVAADTVAGLEGTAVTEALATEEEVPAPMAAKKEEETSGEGSSGEGVVTTAAEEDLEDEEGGVELEAIAALSEERRVLVEED